MGKSIIAHVLVQSDHIKYNSTPYWQFFSSLGLHCYYFCMDSLPIIRPKCSGLLMLPPWPNFQPKMFCLWLYLPLMHLSVITAELKYSIKSISFYTFGLTSNSIKKFVNLKSAGSFCCIHTVFIVIVGFSCRILRFCMCTCD